MTNLYLLQTSKRTYFLLFMAKEFRTKLCVHVGWLVCVVGWLVG